MYWGSENGEIGYLDTRKLSRRDYSGLVINHVVGNMCIDDFQSAGITSMHLCDDGTHLIYSTADGHLLLVNIE